MGGGPDRGEHQPFDEFFVRSAPRVEPSAEERIAQNTRIASQHEQATQWRVGPPLYPGPTYQRPQSYAPRKRGPRALVALGLVIALAWTAVHFEEPIRAWLTHYAPDSTASDIGRMPQGIGSQPGVEKPSTPTDAAAVPLGAPAPAPPGSGGFQFLDVQAGSGRPVAFDPCRPIHFVVRPSNEIPGGRAILLEAIAEVSRVTGLVFTNDGQSDEAPSDERPALQRERYGDRWAPVLIAWSDPVESPRLAGTVAGYAGPQSIGSTQPGSRHYVTGQVVLDAPDLANLTRVPSGRAQVKAIILHELAHLVGLDHVDDRGQLMYPENVGLKGYADGDLRGLHELGLGRCFTEG